MFATSHGPAAIVLRRNRRASWRAAWICGYTFLFFGGLVLTTADGGPPHWLGSIFVATGGLLMLGGLLVPFHDSRLIAVDWRGVRFRVGRWGSRETLIPWAKIEAAGVGRRRINRNTRRRSQLRMFYLRMRVPPSDSFLSTHVRWSPDEGEIQLLHPPKAGFGAVMQAIRNVRSDFPLEGDVTEMGPVRSAGNGVLAALFDTALVGFTAMAVLLVASHGTHHIGAFAAGLEQERTLDLSTIGSRFYRHFPLTLREQMARLLPGGDEDWLASYERGQRAWRDETRPGMERFEVAEAAFVAALDRLTPTLASRRVSVMLLREIFDSADSVMRTQGRWDEIESLTRRKLKLFSAYLGPDRFETGAAHEALGHVLVRRGDTEAAGVEFAEAVRVYELRGRAQSIETLHRKRMAAR